MPPRQSAATTHDPTCGSGGLLIKCEIAMEEAAKGKKHTFAPLKLYGQESTPETGAMTNMNMIIHDMESQIEIGDTFKNPKFRDKRGKSRTFDRVVANPMWNLDWFTEADYDADELGRFPVGAGFLGKSSADCPSLRCAPHCSTANSAKQWGWVQHIHASLKFGADGQNAGRAAIVLFLNRAKPKERQHRVLLVNASRVFEKGDPKNFIPPAGIQRIADTLITWKAEEKFSRIVDHAELKKNDYNISPSRYIHTSDAETYRPIAQIVEELKAIEAEARETDQALNKLLKRLGVGA
jgi:type I restriction enzyme M protein